LTIHGNVHRLDGYQENPACLLVRQMDKIFEFNAKLDHFDDREYTGQEAGVVMWMSKPNHASLAIRLTLNGEGERVREVVFRRPKAAGIDNKIVSFWKPINVAMARELMRFAVTAAGEL
jgi:hypothetical protein